MFKFLILIISCLRFCCFEEYGVYKAFGTILTSNFPVKLKI